MSISNSAIQKEFRKQLDTVGSIPADEYRAWENRTFKPTKGEPWIREQMLPGDERISANEEIQSVGIMQFDYFVPVGYSIFAAKDTADAIKDAFGPDTVLGGLVRIDAARVLPGQKDPTGVWYQLPIQIDYTVYSIN